jgi:hypothetical protein
MGKMPKNITLITYTQIFVWEFPKKTSQLKEEKTFCFPLYPLTFVEVKE